MPKAQEEPRAKEARTPKEKFFALCQLTFIDPSQLRSALQRISGNPTIRLSNVGLALLTEAVEAMLEGREDLEGFKPLCLAAFERAAQELGTIMTNQLQVFGPGHPQGWGLLSNVASRSLRGELAATHIHPSFEEAEARTLDYLNPDQGADAVWRDVWQARWRLLNP